MLSERVSPANCHIASIVHATIFSLAMVVNYGYGQSRDLGLGKVSTIYLARQYDRFSIHPDSYRDSLIRVFCWQSTVPKFDVYQFDEIDQHIQPVGSFATTWLIDDIVFENVDQDAKPELLLVHKKDKKIAVYKESPELGFEQKHVNDLPFEPTEIFFADLTNDRRIDLLAYSRSLPGLHLFAGDGRGVFKQKSMLTPESMIGAIAFAHLNNDGLLDIIVYDWVKNVFALHYGVGRGRFLEQTTISAPSNLRWLKAERTSPRNFLDLITYSTDPPVLQIWEGNGFGDFIPSKKIDFKDHPIDVAIGDINHDRWKDVIVLERPNLLTIYLNGRSNALSERFVYTSNIKEGQLKFSRKGSGENREVLALDKENSRMLWYGDGSKPLELIDSLTFAAGKNPSAIWIGDYTGNTFNDILVINKDEGGFSWYENLQNEGFVGARSFSIPEAAQYLNYHSHTDTSVSFLVTHRATGAITFLSHNKLKQSTEFATITGVGELEVLHTSRADNGFADFFCFDFSTPKAAPSLSQFSQIARTKFIERSFSLSIPYQLYGASVGHINPDHILDVVYLFRNSVTGKYELVTALGDSNRTTFTKVFSTEMSDTLLHRAYMYLEDLNQDGIPDLLICYPKIGRLVKGALGKGDGKFGDFFTIVDNVQLTDRSQLKVFDFDQDDIPDMMVNDAVSKGLLLLRGKGDGTFLEKEMLIQRPDISHFAVGELNGDGFIDIAVTLRDAGVLKIYSSFLFMDNKK